MNDLKDLKKAYKSMKAQGKEERIAFLDSIVSYCLYLKFSPDKIKMFLGLVRNILPGIGEVFTSCDIYDEIDIEYNKELWERLEKLDEIDRII